MRGIHLQQMATATVDIPQGSHHVDEMPDGKVRIRGVSLFSAYDEAIDGPTGDKEIKGFDAAAVMRTVHRTKQYMERGQNPKLVLRHEGDEESIGDVTSVHAETRNGVATVVGDMEMDRTTFDMLIASNRYPRRSAEILYDDGQAAGPLAEVALLGRETPRRPVEDTKFARKGRRIACERDAAEFSMPGAANVLVPDATNGDDDMTALADRMDRMESSIATLLGRIENNAAAGYGIKDDDEDAGKIKNSDDDDDRVENAADDDDDDDDKDKDEMHNADTRTRLGRVEATNRDLLRTVNHLHVQNRRLECSRHVDELENDGYAVGTRRDELVGELASLPADQVAGKVEMWREMFQRAPINRVVAGMGHARTANGTEDSALTEAGFEKCRARAMTRIQNDGKLRNRFAEVLNEEIDAELKANG